MRVFVKEMGFKNTGVGSTLPDASKEVNSIRCRCRWKWESSGLCARCHDKLRPGTCILSSAFMFFLCSFALCASVAMLFAWLTVSPYQFQKWGSLAGAGCRPDDEGSWSIGLFRGNTPFSLQAIEKANMQNDGASAWPVANPVLSCASVSGGSHASNFVADPFLYIKGEKLYAFFETKNTLTMQGDIGVAESADGGATWKYLGIALDEEWHLSYPFVFYHNGQIYMMPEGSKKGDLRLYRAVNFPLQWTFEKVIIKRPLVDATMLERDGIFWIFASDHQRFGSRKNGELEIWYAQTPFGHWRQHRGNPVHNGNRSLGARSAGRPFMYEGQVYRPGQDCGETYGHKVRVFRIDVLTKTMFQEVEVPLGIEVVEKGRNIWNGVRSHHLDVQKLPSGDWIALMDGDRVPSGDVSMSFFFGIGAIFFLVLLNIFIGWLYGFFRCIFQSSRYLKLGKKMDTTTLPWAHSQWTSKLYRTALRINREGARVRHKSCIGFSFLFICFILGSISVCIAVKCLFGGNGAEEPYPMHGVFSQFTLLTMTYDARLWNLKMYIKHYSRCASVREIVVVWNKGKPPNPDTEFDTVVPVRIRVEAENSLNNRFKPDDLIKTRAVLELDDDIMMTCDDLERGFRAWRENPNRIVGFYPRLVDGVPLEYRNERYARSKKGYNMILTGAAFVDRDLAFQLYWKKDAEKGRHLVNELFNCEDILLNFIMANGTSRRKVEYVHPIWAIDTSRFSSAAISRNTQSHYEKRTNCLMRFTQLYGGLPLKTWEFNSRRDGWDY